VNLGRLIGEILGREGDVPEREEGKKNGNVETQQTAHTDEDATERVARATRVSREAIAGAQARHDRFWREIEHADRVMGARRK